MEMDLVMRKRLDWAVPKAVALRQKQQAALNAGLPMHPAGMCSRRYVLQAVVEVRNRNSVWLVRWAGMRLKSDRHQG